MKIQDRICTLLDEINGMAILIPKTTSSTLETAPLPLPEISGFAAESMTFFSLRKITSYKNSSIESLLLP